VPPRGLYWATIAIWVGSHHPWREDKVQRNWSWETFSPMATLFLLLSQNEWLICLSQTTVDFFLFIFFVRLGQNYPEGRICLQYFLGRHWNTAQPVFSQALMQAFLGLTQRPLLDIKNRAPASQLHINPMSCWCVWGWDVSSLPKDPSPPSFFFLLCLHVIAKGGNIKDFITGKSYQVLFLNVGITGNYSAGWWGLILGPSM
jgi:hypothetical protein